MTDNELLLSIAKIMDKKIKPLEQRMDSFDTRLNEVTDNISEMKIDIIEMKGDIVEMKGDIVEMKGDIRNINLKLENIIEPRLDHIEDCYLTTFERYKIGVDKFDKMETDISVLQSVVMEHGERLQSTGA